MVQILNWGYPDLNITSFLVHGSNPKLGLPGFEPGSRSPKPRRLPDYPIAPYN
jgi:hypothetical protein